MKKVLILLAVLLISTAAFAQDVYWSGWFETKGQIAQQNGVNNDDPAMSFGPTTFDYELYVTGENFGMHSLLEYWADNGADVSRTATGETVLEVANTYIYADYLEGALRVQGGYKMHLPTAAPGAVLEGGIYNDAFGLGFGRYNYQGGRWEGDVQNNYSDSPTGLYFDVNAAGFNLGVAVKNDNSQATLEDTFKNGLIIQFNYGLEGVADFFGGYHTRDEAGGLWVGASVTAIDNLVADLKFEMAQGADVAWWYTADVNAISANLGYHLDAASVLSEVVIKMIGDGNEVGSPEAMTTFDISAGVTTGALEVVDLAAGARFMGSDVEDSDLAMAFHGKVSKSIGNVGNSLDFQFATSTADGAELATTVVYAINIWF